MSTLTDKRREVDERNAETSRQEVAAFLVDEPGPYFAYCPSFPFSRGSFAGSVRVTTWTGDELGRVIGYGDVYYSNFGDRRQNFRAMMVNGRVYAGTAYVDAGDYVRLRPVKADRRESAQVERYVAARRITQTKTS